MNAINLNANEPVAVSSLALIRKLLKPLASLQLTVFLLAISLGLVFFGTLAQKTSGLWTVVDRYFWSWFVFIDFEPILEFGKIFCYIPTSWHAPSWFGFPYPGGKLIGGLMFLNLLAAHAVRFRFTWKRVGIVIAHTGLLLLFVGEAITRECQVEQRMTIREGETVNFSEDSRAFELAISTSETDGLERVTVIPASLLAHSVGKGVISNPQLPVDIRVDKYMANSNIIEQRDLQFRKADRKPIPENLATVGLGLNLLVESRPEVAGVDSQPDVPSAYITLINKQTNQEIGTYLVSYFFTWNNFERQKNPSQSFSIDHSKFDISLRPTRYYKPFSLYLEKFRFDRYIGTDSPKNYSSDLKIIDPERGQERDVHIKMNEPLRYRGETFYQSNFDKTTEQATVLSVVRNPGAILPYLACAFVSGGLTLHFLIVLTRFLTQPRKQQASKSVDSIGLILAFSAVVGLIIRFGLGRQFFDDLMGPIGSGTGNDFGVVAQLFDLLAIFTLPVLIALLLRTIGGQVTSSTSKSNSGTIFEKLLPWGMFSVVVVFFASLILPKANKERFDLPTVERLPVVDGGRLKPFDTAARVFLRKISGREEYVAEDGKMHPASRWLLDMLSVGESSDPTFRDSPALKHRVIRIENDQVLSLLNLQRREGLRYSWEEVVPRVKDIRSALDNLQASGGDKSAIDPKFQKLFESGDRRVFETQLAEVGEKIKLCDRLLSRAIPLMLAPDGNRQWRSIGDLDESARTKAFLGGLSKMGILPKDFRQLPESQQTEVLKSCEEDYLRIRAEDPASYDLEKVMTEYRRGDRAKFEAALESFSQNANNKISQDDLSRVRFEVLLNEAAYTYYVTFIYLLAALLTLGGWVALLFRPSLAESLRRSAYWSLIAAFVVHGFALAARMYLMDRPLVFVTNLYSTAVFIGWAAVGLGLVLERVFPLGLGNLMASVVSGITAIIAHNLAATSDTLEMMQAVLDSNFWLATHVTTINIGYCTTYVAGVAAIAYILLGLFTPILDHVSASPSQPNQKPETIGKALGKLMYGVVCLATLTSFVGTVLGGIWADDSWGRFWGWDPKENGAVLIVIWNAMILHARWCGLIKDRGTAVLCLGGNMVTTWSYFGTNQLSVGLHAYGFNSTLAQLCLLVWLGNLLLMAIGLIPTRFWNSGYTQPQSNRPTIQAKVIEVRGTQKLKGKRPSSGRG